MKSLPRSTQAEFTLNKKKTNFSPMMFSQVSYVIDNK